MNYLQRIAKITIPWLVIALVAGFFYETLSGNLDKLEGIDISVNGWTIAGVVSFTLAVIVSGLLWGRLLAELSQVRVKYTDAIRIHCASWLLKYIPGQVGSLINKITWGARHGITKKPITTSFIYENTLMVIAGVTLSLPVLLLFRQQIGDNLALFVPVLMVIPMLLVLSRKSFFWLLALLLKLAKRPPLQRTDLLPGRALVKYQVGYLLPRLLNGVGFVLIVHSLVSVPPSMYVGLAATYILASIVGLLAFFVPGGLGVREAVIVVFLSIYFPVEQAIIIALVVRFYATISDIVVALIYIGLNKGRLRQQ